MANTPRCHKTSAAAKALQAKVAETSVERTIQEMFADEAMSFSETSTFALTFFLRQFEESIVVWNVRCVCERRFHSESKLENVFGVHLCTIDTYKHREDFRNSKRRTHVWILELAGGKMMAVAFY